MEPFRTFSNWARAASISAETRGCLHAAYQYLYSKQKKRVMAGILSKWASHSVRMQRLSRAAARSGTRFRHSRARKVMGAWRESAHVSASLSMQVRGIKRHLDRIRVRSTFHTMRSAIARSRNKDKMASYAKLLAGKSFPELGCGECFRAWNELASSGRKVRAAVLLMCQSRGDLGDKAAVGASFGAWAGVTRMKQTAVKSAMCMAERVQKARDLSVKRAMGYFFVEIWQMACMGKAAKKAGKASRMRKICGMLQAWRDWAAWRVHLHRISGRLQRKHALSRRSITQHTARVSFSLWSDLAKQMVIVRSRAERSYYKHGRAMCKWMLEEWQYVSDMQSRMKRILRIAHAKRLDLARARALSGWSMVASAEKLANASAAR